MTLRARIVKVIATLLVMLSASGTLMTMKDDLIELDVINNPWRGIVVLLPGLTAVILLAGIWTEQIFVDKKKK